VTADGARLGRGGHAGQGRALALTLLATAAVLLVELAGAYFGRSVALLADAGHIATDILAVGLTYMATGLAGRAPTERRSFGYERAVILAAFVNALLLFVLAGGLAVAAVGRLLHPALPRPAVMGGAALVALALNLFVTAGLFGHRHEIALRSVLLHYAGDAAGSLGVLLAAGAVFAFHWPWVDPAVSLAIAALIVLGGVSIVRRAVDILMEGAPGHLDPRRVAEAICRAPGVLGVHDLHIWNVGEAQTLLTCHVVVENMSVEESQRLLEALAERLRREHGIDHATFQAEVDAACAGCPFVQAQPSWARTAGSRRAGGS
jgi:cobalt-zinc-cadmium efflux system protein